MLFCHLLTFSKSSFLKKSFRNNIRVSNNLHPDHARHFVGPDLDPNCLQRLSADALVGKELKDMTKNCDKLIHVPQQNIQ